MVFSPGGDGVEDLTTAEKGAAMCGPGLQRVGERWVRGVRGERERNL